jgi:cytochrome c2
MERKITVSPKHQFVAALLLALAISLIPQCHSQVASSAQQTAEKPAASATKAGAAHDSQTQDEGERIFQQNCSRCHWAPDGFSTRISGTIVRHMRVRASLSEHDEKELLRFLNP